MTVNVQKPNLNDQIRNKFDSWFWEAMTNVIFLPSNQITHTHVSSWREISVSLNLKDLNTETQNVNVNPTLFLNFQRPFEKAVL